MAKKKTDDEFDFDNSDTGDNFLDDDGDFNFDDMDADFDSRNVSLKQVGIDALKESFIPESNSEKIKNITDSLKRTLPNKIRQEASDFEGLFDTVSDSVNKNVELLGKDLKIIGGKVDKLLPKEGMFRDFFNSIYQKEDERTAILSEQARKEEEIQRQTTEALGDLAVLNEQQSLRDNVLADKRTSSTNEILKLIAKDTNATKLLGYEYSAKYYKKSLELQFRTVSVLKDTLEANRTSYKEILTQLTSIAKNTSLPDIVKQHNTELITAGIKGKLRDKALDTVFGRDSLFDRIGKKLTSRITELTSQTREYISSGDMIADTLGDFLGGDDSMIDPRSMVAGMATDMARDKLADTMFGRLQKKLFASKAGKKIAFGIKNLHDDPSTWLSELAENRRAKGGVVNRFFSKILGEASDLTRVGVKDENINLRRLDLNTAATLDVRTKVSINQVIPGYLRMLHAETKAHRLGIRDPKVDGLELWYDFDRESFKKGSAISGGLKAFITNKMRSETKSSRDRIRNSFNKDTIKNTLGSDAFTDEELKAIENAAVIGARKNHKTGMAFYRSKEFLSALPEKQRKAVAEKMRKLEEHLKENDEEGWEWDDIRYGVSSLRSSLPSFMKTIENEFRNGNVQHLKQLGLVKYNKSTGEYELDKKKLANYAFDQFGNHEHIMSTQDLNKINVRETVLGTKKKVKEIAGNITSGASNAYDKLVPDSAKKDLSKLGNNVKGKFNAFTGKVTDFGKQGISTLGNIGSGLSSRMSGGIVNYFSSGKFKEDLLSFVKYIRETLIPKLKAKIKSFGELILKYTPEWIKEKYRNLVSKGKEKRNEIGKKLIDRLEPDEQAIVLDTLGKVKAVKYTEIEQKAITMVKKFKNYVENFNADEKYLQLKELGSGIINKITSGKDKAKDFIAGQKESFNQLKEAGLSTKDIVFYKTENALLDARNKAKEGLDSIIDKTSPYLNSAKEFANQVGKIGYHMALSKEKREKLEEFIDDHVIKNWKKVKSYIIDKIPAKLKDLVKDVKDGRKAMAIFREYRLSLPTVERAKFDGILLQMLSKLDPNSFKKGNRIKATADLFTGFMEQHKSGVFDSLFDDKKNAKSTTKIAEEITQPATTEMKNESIKKIAIKAEDVANAIKSIKEVAASMDKEAIEIVAKDLETAKPGILKEKAVKKALDNALKMAGAAAKAGDELMKEIDKEKDEHSKLSMLSNVMGKAWGYVPMGSMLKLGFKGAMMFGKAMWKTEKFMWKHVYSKLIMGPFKAVKWVMDKTILNPIKKLGSWIAGKTGLTKLFGMFKNMFKGGFFKSIGQGAKALASGIGGLFGFKKKRMINGELVDEDAKPGKKEKGGGLLGLIKSFGSKLMFLLGPIAGILTSIFKKGPGGFISSMVGSLGKGIYNVLRHSMPKLMGNIFGACTSFLKNGITGAFSLVSSGLTKTFSMFKGLIGGAANVAGNVGSAVAGFGSKIWDFGKNLVNKGIDTVKGVAGKIGNWITQGFNKAKSICGKLTNAMYEKIVGAIDKFSGLVKNKLGGKLGKALGGKALTKIIGNVVKKIALRLSPLGTALLAYDVGNIGLMMFKGVAIMSAISICFIGVDLFADDDVNPEDLSPDITGDGEEAGVAGDDIGIAAGAPVTVNKAAEYLDSSNNKSTTVTSGRQDSMGGLKQVEVYQPKVLPPTRDAGIKPINVNTNVTTDNSDILKQNEKFFNITNGFNNALIEGNNNSNKLLEVVVGLLENNNKLMAELSKNLSRNQADKINTTSAPVDVYSLRKN